MAAEPASLVDVVLLPMQRRHLRAALRIENQVYPRPWTTGLFQSELALGDRRTYLVAKASSKLVGYGGALYVLPDAHITTIAVEPSFQRQGIGVLLLHALCRAAVDKGATALTLEVRTSNEPALRLYRRFGFAPAGVREGYYTDPVEDAVIMWAHDVDGAAFAARLDELAPRQEAS
ncbi:MAG: ribosomal protein S18-alanine N-acetyltransferase [Actinomycetota bacterium]|nr:ribosomal protein S18-alanine N-acetyltransferase [Acidimicrobiia bacterium]MDQ3294213.1 ribosomal protein S18-alanine N-acetyltransferase [Actinomycetota bacterium]